MRAFTVLLLLLLAIPPVLRGQSRAAWVFFRDKGPDAATQLADATPASLGVSAAAMERRMAGGVTLLSADLPLHVPYAEAVAATGARIRARSRWLNAVSAEMTAEQRARVAALPCVARVEEVHRGRALPLPPPPPLPRAAESSAGHSIDYGYSLQQVAMIAVPPVHDIWIDGTGIVVGMLDNGYRWKRHEALRDARVRGEYDFIQKDTVTENQAGDAAGQDGHGTSTFSALAGMMPGVLVGPAFNAEYYLAKTEVNGSETPVEEDYWVEGLEWLESRGCAVVSSSLAYADWDDGTGYSYAHGDFDGRTAVTTRAAAQAARFGVLVVNAMGNEGNQPGTLIAPADADSIVSVGAVTFAGETASFSSNGPTNDGRTKPDVVAPGVAVLCATNLDSASYTRANGTSLATPLTAGVAALVRSARPELTPVQVRNTLRATADGAAAPSNSRGWGLVQAWDALLYNGMVISTNPPVTWNGRTNAVLTYVVSPSPVQREETVLSWRVDGGAFTEQRMQFLEQHDMGAEGSGLYHTELPPLPSGALVEFSISARDAAEQRTSPWRAPASLHRFHVGESHGSGSAVPADYALFPGFPNPAGNDGVTMRFDVPQPGGTVRIDLFDEAGRHAAALVDGTPGPGMHLLTVPTATLPSAAYLVRMAAGGGSYWQKLVVAR